MEHLLYERPREKLRNRGPRALSIAELIQLIIGSGSGGASVGRIAREVEKLIQSDTATYKALLEVTGIGEAKACQLLAALELAYRHSSSVGTSARK